MRRTWPWAAVAVVVLAVLYLPSLGVGDWSILGWVVFLLCPLIHLFGLHGAHRHGHDRDARTSAGRKNAPPVLEGRDEA